MVNSRGWYNPRWHYEHEPETREALDLLFGDQFGGLDTGVFAALRENLLDRGDYYMHLADLASYIRAQSRVSELYADRAAWGRKAIKNVGCSGKFSSDRTISEYAADIWGAEPCPVD